MRLILPLCLLHVAPPEAEEIANVIEASLPE